VQQHDDKRTVTSFSRAATSIRADLTNDEDGT